MVEQHLTDGQKAEVLRIVAHILSFGESSSLNEVGILRAQVSGAARLGTALDEAAYMNTELYKERNNG